MKELKIDMHETMKIVCEDGDIEINIKCKRKKEIEVNMVEGGILVKPEYANQITIKREGR